MGPYTFIHVFSKFKEERLLPPKKDDNNKDGGKLVPMAW
jgi:hypothetical protein